ncbi:BrnA antitoxin family protein [Rhodanobacter lindaniclasticus]
MRDEYDFSKAKRGAVLPSPGKTRITIMLDTDVIEGFRVRAEAAGTGYQTEINRALRQYLAEGGEQLTLAALRRMIREELRTG